MSTLANMLIDAGLSRERLEECRRLAGESGESLDRVILSKAYMHEADLLRVYAQHLGFEYRDKLEDISVPTDFVNRIPVQFTRSYNLVALAEENGLLKVATCTPLDPHPMDDLSALYGSDIEPVLAPRNEITSLIGRAYRHKADGVDQALADVAEDGDIAGLAEEIDEGEDVLDVSNKAPIIKLVNTILFQALEAARVRRALPSVRRPHAGALPHRRHPLRHGPDPAQGAGGHRQPRQGHGQDGHRRAAPAPGRASDHPHRRRRGRRADQLGADHRRASASSCACSTRPRACTRSRRSA